MIIHLRPNDTEMAEEGRQIIFNMVKVGKTLPSGKKILNDIYLGFYYGAKIGILGLNGSGKSTLMRIIAASWAGLS